MTKSASLVISTLLAFGTPVGAAITKGKIVIRLEPVATVEVGAQHGRDPYLGRRGLVILQ